MHTNLLICDVVIIESLSHVEEAGNEEEEGAGVLDTNSWRKGRRWKVRDGKGRVKRGGEGRGGVERGGEGRGGEGRGGVEGEERGG